MRNPDAAGQLGPQRRLPLTLVAPFLTQEFDHGIEAGIALDSRAFDPGRGIHRFRTGFGSAVLPAALQSPTALQEQMWVRQ